ncbi:MAG TPA: hypothetical protein VM582_09265 [Candidatus Thermoplasmatota archaeon]|nr:hypothetical protein [Candidatus Thermoplasmatota archaeon]
MRPRGWTWTRIGAVALATFLALCLLMATLLGGLHRDESADLAFTRALLAGAALGALLAVLGRGRWAAAVLVGVALGGVAFDVASGSGFAYTWWLWAVAVAAAALAWPWRR